FKMFPEAEVKFIWLGRNPLASVNGLYDGWLYDRGFYSHNMKGRTILDIKGYSDTYEWSKWWWNFDLPPGWEEYTQAKLQEVCLFQWYTANLTIEEWLSHNWIWTMSRLSVRYEDLITDRVGTIKEISSYLRISYPSLVEDAPIVQATEPPSLGRWKKRKQMLIPLLFDSAPDKLELCNRMGYDPSDVEVWK
ncbi:hypothetical protein LCGC14_3102950, partial [marine sediment metagenome]